MNTKFADLSSPLTDIDEVNMNYDSLPVLLYLKALFEMRCWENLNRKTNPANGVAEAALINPEDFKTVDVGVGGLTSVTRQNAVHDLGAGGAVTDSAMATAGAAYQVTLSRAQIVGVCGANAALIIDSNDGTPIVAWSVEMAETDSAGAWTEIPVILDLDLYVATTAVNKTFGLTWAGPANLNVDTITTWGH